MRVAMITMRVAMKMKYLLINNNEIIKSLLVKESVGFRGVLVSFYKNNNNYLLKKS